MRIDKYLSNLWYWTRKEIKNDIKDWKVYINWDIVKKEWEKLKIWDEILFYNTVIEYIENIYLMINKSQGFVSSNINEANYKSYKSLIEDCPYRWIVEVAWRLDVDTTWLLFCTNNWEVIHKLINSKKEIFKTYYVKAKEKICIDDIKKLEIWVKIDDFITKPAKVKPLSDTEIELSISEWKFHQVKKMLESVNNKVIKLHRIKIWELNLWDLELWKWRYLDDNEIKYLESL